MKIEAIERPVTADHPLAELLLSGGADRTRERHPHEPSLQGVLEAGEATLDAPIERAKVVERLLAYNQGIGNSRAADLCQKLGDPRCLVVTSGHQPGLFGGPLMVFAKAAGCVLLARKLEEAWNGPVVALWWNHSEDHDVDEIKNLSIMSQGSPTRLKAPLSRTGRSFDHMLVESSLSSFAEQALSDMGLAGEPEALLPVQGERFPLWTTRCLLALLGGMEMLHAEPFVLRPLLSEFFARTVEDVENLGAAARAGADAVCELGHEAQVRVANESQLFLVGGEGQRSRLLLERPWLLAGSEGFEREIVTNLTTAGLTALARSRPEMFSCNVLLRPLVLQELLPVACHVCGPGEMAYFGQLPELFAWAGRPVPAVVPRPRVTLIGPAEEDARLATGLEGDWVLREASTWPADPSGEAQGEREPGRLRHHLAQWVAPRGRTQERIFGPLALMRGSDPRILSELMGLLDPWDFRHQVLTLERGDLHAV